MSKRLIMILALLFVAGITMAAYAEVQNVKVSGDLLIRGVARNNFQNRATDAVFTGINDKDRSILSAVRVRADADLTDNVSATVRLLNERAWGLEAGVSSTAITLDLAYATLKEFLYSPLTLVVGRQELRYGNALIIGDPDTNTTSVSSNLPATLADLSVRKSFDAVKAVLNYDPLVLDLVYAKIEENTSNRADDVTLMGLNTAYTVNKNLLTEGYFWSRDRQYGSTGLTAVGPSNGERLNVLGARGVYGGIKNLTLGIEGAWQFGDHLAAVGLYPDEARTAANHYKSKVNAYALQITSALGLPVRYGPVLNFNYTRLSGDRDQSLSDNYTGWNPMFEDQSGGTIANRVLAYSNAQIFNLGGTLTPMEDLKVSLNYYHIRLLRTFDTGAGATTRHLSGLAADVATTVQPCERHLADELDLNILYDYTEDVQLGLSAGLFMPGAAYDNTNNNAAEQLIGSMKVTF